MLDEFSTQTTAAKPPASGPGRPDALKDHASNLPALEGEDFQADLEKEMASFMNELGNKPELEGSMIDKLGEYIAQAQEASQKEPPGPSASKDEEDILSQLQKDMASMMSDPGENPGQFDDEIAKSLAEIDANPELQQDIQQFLLNLEKASDAVEQEESQADKGKTKPAVPPENTFQETIRKTMARMQESGDQASAAAEASNEEDLLTQLMKEMGGANGAEAGDDDFSKMLLGMMQQLTNKEILYEPMKELHDKFPGWMEKNKETTPKADMGRYEEQQRLVADIVARFEKKGYSDDNVQDREFIVESMQKVCAHSGLLRLC